MRIVTGLRPLIRENEPRGFKTYFHSEPPMGPALYVVETPEEPGVQKMSVRAIMYTDQPEYNIEREEEIRDEYGIPGDAQVEDGPLEGGGWREAFIRLFTWYEVTA